MWVLRCEYRHLNCKYSSTVKRLGILFNAYPISSYADGTHHYLTTLHALEGPREQVRAYIKHVESFALKLDRIDDFTIMTLTRAPVTDEFYHHLYNPTIIYPAPVLHKEGYEHAVLACWEKEPLMAAAQFLGKSPHMADFCIISFKEEKLHVLLWKTLEKLTDKQRFLLDLAIERGYYAVPRKANLDDLSRELKLSKATVHETLRRAEANVLGR